jgi:hypothetical protein
MRRTVLAFGGCRVLEIMCDMFVELKADWRHIARRLPMADNKTDLRQWTSEKPTKSGFYYYRQSNDEEPIVLKVEILDGRKGRISVVWLPGDNAAEPLEQCHGDWAGPIEPPA